MSTILPTFTCSFRPNNKTHTQWTQKPFTQMTPPATDRVIDFGKHKGRMLGTLPSTYLKWVSKNLRTGDFEEWAKLADQVLVDPVYLDRLEWEFADSVLNGNNDRNSLKLLSSGNGSAVSKLLEISERFGWDGEDKEGWSRIRYELLGTSKGGRIPRMGKERERLEGGKEEAKEEVGNGVSEGRRKERRREAEVREGKMGFLLEVSSVVWEMRRSNGGGRSDGGD